MVQRVHKSTCASEHVASKDFRFVDPWHDAFSHDVVDGFKMCPQQGRQTNKLNWIVLPCTG